jgi:hypothetical protein
MNEIQNLKTGKICLGKGTVVTLNKKNSKLMIYINSIYIFTFNIKVMTGGN